MKRNAPSNPLDPAPLRLQTYVGPLKSTDFGAQYNGAPPEHRIAGLALPPPTELIRLPLALKTETAVFLEAEASKRALDYRAAALARSASSVATSVTTSIAEAIVRSAVALRRHLGQVRSSEASHRALAVTKTLLDLGARSALRSLSLSRDVLRAGGRSTLAATRQSTDRLRAIAKRFAASMAEQPPQEVRTFDAGRECVLSLDSELRTKASETGAASARLEAGTRVTAFLGFHAAPDGWVLAQTPEGEIGFVRLEHLRFMTRSVLEDLC